jgi:hypothetical protein
LWQAQTEELTLRSFATPQKLEDPLQLKPPILLLDTPLPEARRAAIAKLGAQRFNAMAEAVTPGIEFHNQHIGQYSTPGEKLVNQKAFVALCESLAKLTESGENGERIGTMLHNTLDRVGFTSFAHEHASHAFAPDEKPVNVISVFPTEPMGNALYTPEELDLENVDALLPRAFRRQPTLAEAVVAQIVSDVKDLGPDPSTDTFAPAFNKSVGAILAAVKRDPTITRYNEDAREVFAAMFQRFAEARLPKAGTGKKLQRQDFEFKVIKDTLAPDVFAQKFAKYVAEYMQKTSHTQVKSKREYLNSLRTKGQEIYKEAVGILQKAEGYDFRAQTLAGDYLYYLFVGILNTVGEGATASFVAGSYVANLPK